MNLRTRSLTEETISFPTWVWERGIDITTEGIEVNFGTFIQLTCRILFL